MCFYIVKPKWTPIRVGYRFGFFYICLEEKYWNPSYKSFFSLIRQSCRTIRSPVGSLSKNPHPKLSNKSGFPASMPLGENCTNCPILHCRVVYLAWRKSVAVAAGLIKKWHLTPNTGYLTHKVLHLLHHT